MAMVLAATERLLPSVPVSNGDIAALHSHNYFLIAGAALHICEGSGAHLLSVFLIVAAAVSLLWLVASAVGRIVTLLPLSPEANPNYAGVFGLSFLRMLWAWLGVALCLAVIVGSSFAAAEVSNDLAHPNFALYFLLLAVGLPIVLIVWSVLNWYLSLAPIFCLREAKGTFASVGSTMRAARARRREFFRVSSAYTLPRLIALLFVIVLATLAAAGLNQTGAIVAVVLLSLAYFALADFFYIARLAAYIQLVSKEEPAQDPVVAPAATEQPLPQSF